MPTYKTKMPDSNGSSQQSVFVSKRWKKQGWLYSYKFIFSSNFSSDTSQIEILPNRRCQASVIVATVTHTKFYEDFKRLQCLYAPLPLCMTQKKGGGGFIVWSHFTMPFIPYLIVHSVHWDGGLLSPLRLESLTFAKAAARIISMIDNTMMMPNTASASFSCLVYFGFTFFSTNHHFSVSK